LARVWINSIHGCGTAQARLRARASAEEQQLKSSLQGKEVALSEASQQSCLRTSLC